MAFITSPLMTMGRTCFGFGKPFLKFFDGMGMLHTITEIKSVCRDGDTVILKLPDGEEVKITAPTRAEAIRLEITIQDYFPVYRKEESQ